MDERYILVYEEETREYRVRLLEKVTWITLYKTGTNRLRKLRDFRGVPVPDSEKLKHIELFQVWRINKKLN